MVRSGFELFFYCEGGFIMKNTLKVATLALLGCTFVDGEAQGMNNILDQDTSVQQREQQNREMQAMQVRIDQLNQEHGQLKYEVEMMQQLENEAKIKQMKKQIDQLEYENSQLRQQLIIGLPYTIPGYLNSYRESGGDMPLVLKYNEIEVEVGFTNFHLNPELFIELSIRKSLLYGVDQNRLLSSLLVDGHVLTVDQQKLVEFLNDFGIHSLNKKAKTVVDAVNKTLNNDFINYALSLYNDMSGINLFKNLSKEGQAALLPAFHKYIGEHFLGDGIYRYNILTRCYAPWLTLNKVVKCDNDTNHTDIRSIANGIYGRTNEKELRSSYVNLAKSTLTNVYIQHSGVDLSEKDKSAIREYYSDAKI